MLPKNVVSILRQGLRDPPPNYSGLVVIGAGLPRTGTFSLKYALSQLLEGPCYHMANLAYSNSNVDVNHWHKLFLGGKCSKQEWIDFYEGNGFRATVDFPSALFFKEIMAAYPEAKVILTVRDCPEQWYQSVLTTIHQEALSKFPYNLAAHLLGKTKHFQTVELTLGFQTEHFPKGLRRTIDGGKEEAVTRYSEWTKHVKDIVPDEKLLVFNVKEGWEPLCKFLNVPQPRNSFPRLNDSKSFNQDVQLAKFLRDFFP